VNPLEIEERLKTHFPDAILKLTDLTGGGDHWQLVITAAAFQGKSLVAQHQLVYKALGDWMTGPIHALALTTQVP
jgi:stress-induced morphogen